MKRIYMIRAFGWQLDYRPDGWLPLGIREELGVTWSGPRWHVLRLGRFGCSTLGRLERQGEVTVTLTADTTAYVAAIDRARAELEEAGSLARYRLRVSMERSLGMLYVAELLDEWRRDLGIERSPS